MVNFRKQPAKAFYLAYQAWTIFFFRLPFWFFISIIPSMRPRPTWSILRCLYVRLIRHGLSILGVVGRLRTNPDHLAIVSGVGIDAEWIEPDRSLILGKLADFADTSQVEPVRIPGYWLRQPGSSRDVLPGEKVVLALHGGAYVSLSAYPGDITAGIVRGLIKHTPAIRHILSLEYRLCAQGAHPFPAALLDAVAAYAHLIRNHGVSPQNIIIEGDSAGGNLALALTRYLVEHREQLSSTGLAPPGGLLLLSPWCDMGTSHDLDEPPPYLKRSDVIILGTPQARLKYVEKLFTGPHGLAAADTNPYISPASMHLPEPISFAGFPRTFIVCGGAEALAPQIRTLKERMGADLGPGEFVYYEAPDGIHDYISISWHEPERTETLRTISTWVSSA